MSTSSEGVTFERLKPKRAAQRGRNTKIVNEVSSALERPDVTVEELAIFMERLEASNSKLDKINEDIEQLLPSEEIEEEYTVIAEYEDQALHTLARLKCAIKRLGTGTNGTSPQQVMTTTASPVPESQQRSPVIEQDTSAGTMSGIKLQKLDLYTFSGDMLSWQPFWEQYRSAVHENPRLNTTEKFHYLRSRLTGQAAAAVAGLQTTEACYNDAIDILTKRFGDKKRIEQQYLSRLRLLNQVKSSSDVKGLRRLYDYVQGNIRGLQALGVSPLTYSSMMCDILLKAMPPDIVVDYHRSVKQAVRAAQASVEAELSSESELHQILDFLCVEVESRERCDTSSDPQRNNSRNGYDKRQDKKMKHPTAAVLHTSAKETPQCFFCKSQTHSTESCRASLSLEEKRNRLSRDMRCFICTWRGHRSRDCRRKITCATCKGRHATTMCDPSRRKPALQEDKVESINLFATNKNTVSKFDCDVLLQTFRAWAVTESDCDYVRGIIDGGSQRTFVKEDVSRRLNLPFIRKIDLRLSTFADDTSTPSQRRNVVQLRLRSQFDQSECVLEAIEIPIVCKDMATIPVNDAFVKQLNERGMNLADRVMFPNGGTANGISVLIGSDQLWKLVKTDVQHNPQNNAMVAINTTFGWTLQGPTMTKSSLSSQSNSLVCVLRTAVEIEDDTSVELRRFWDLEHIGITEDGKQDKGHKELLDSFGKSIKFEDGRYHVNLPFEEESSGYLHDNKAVAYNRLHGLMKKLHRNPDLLERYDNAIRTYLEDGHAEKVPPSGQQQNTGQVYYMPHRPVLRESSSTTKLRFVFDASSHAEGKRSLNDFLQKGPNMVPDLVQLLLKFRLHRIAITADVRKAFLQIGIKQEDRDFLRFLWFANSPALNNEERELEEWRMTRVPFGTTASPFLLAATLSHHLDKMKEEFPETASMLNTSMYVDDLITGSATLEEARRIHSEATEIMKRAGMILDKWSSNCRELEDVFGPPTDPILTLGQKEETKVLGVVWHRDEDNFRFNPSTIMEFLINQRNTKRCVLQASARIFDPLGFLSPFVIRVKVLFQKLWELGADWDHELPSDLCAEWRAWCNDIQKLCLLNVPRCVVPTAEHSGYTLQIHVFTDASPRAYGAAVYLRVEAETGHVFVNLLTAKSRVAPIKRLTLPRLELMGALLGARLMKCVAGIVAQGPVQCYLWSDSTVALCWIHSPASKWKPFVSNRVMEIQLLTDPSRWRHCPGHCNPADLVTRGISSDALVGSSLWWEGPPWLREHEEHWPKSYTPAPENNSEMPVTEEERKTSKDTDPHVVLQVSDRTQSLLEIDRYSSMSRALRVTAWMLRFINRCRRTHMDTTGPLTAEELQSAESYWLRETQRDAYPHEIKKLREGCPVPPQSKLLELNPFLDDERLLRMRSRLEHAEMGAAVKHPIVLPPDHSFTELLVTSAHRRILHGGVLETMTDIRDRFWIPRCRQLVKKIIRRCSLCHRQKLKAATAPVAPLPSDRINKQDPFAIVGIDFAGPLYVKTADGEIKSYITLFTCAVTRAVHLEIVSNLTTTNFLMAFRRFISRRGLPQVIYSDNALTFRRAAKDIRCLWELLSSPAVRDFCSLHRIGWKFIVERAAWWGGWWERMVRTVKTCLRKTLGRSRVNYEELETILQEVEAAVNSRPLTTISAEATEMEPLTPAHFLIGKRISMLPSLPLPVPPGANIAEDMRRRLAHRRRVGEHFWNRWQREYLLQLRSAHLDKRKGNHNLKIGDVVIVHDSNAPKLNWKMGRICDLYRGRDNNVRACEVELHNSHRLRRAVQHLYPLEMSEAHSGGGC
ncbi:uncharacterized protein LOC135398725 [Ornithodoros turicata]|uniref:uncharacterized protein LOC135398725 n=1 Tax=Ornithodoros turicata TaxID=34597 RepID=UPI00313A48B7